MKNKLLLVGGGGHCKSVIDVAENAGWEIIGILDTEDKVGKKVLSYDIIGTDSDIVNWIGKVKFLVTVGYIKDVSLRMRIHNDILSLGGEFATVVASTAYVSKYACIGEDSVIMHKAMVNAGANIGNGCIINTFANIEHDAKIDDFCHISTGAMVNGECRIGKRVFLGSQSVMVNGTSIVEDCIIAAGTLVRKDIVKKGIYSDNPAILKKKL